MLETKESGSISETIANFASKPISAEAFDLASARLLDAVGIAIAGRRTPQGLAAIESARHLMGSGPCGGLNGETGYSPHGSAFINATLIHALDFDDTYLAGAVHTHPTVIPAALAVADLRGSSIREVIVASAIGTEVVCWLSKWIGRELHGKGFHPTAVVGGIGALLAAARLLHLDRQQTIDGIGLIGTVSAGTWQFEESWVKNWNVAIAAQNGLGSAIAASARFVGPKEPIEGQYGLLATHLDKLTRPHGSDLGSPWLSTDISMKRYGCCHFLQSVVECVLGVAKSVPLEEIRHVLVKLPSELAMRCVALPIEARKSPENSYRARFAGFWLVARGLIDRDVDLTTFDEFAHRTDQLQAMIDKITFEIADLQGYPEYWPAQINITTTSGATKTFQDDGRSSDFGRSNASSVREKFRQNIAYAGLSGSVADQILACVVNPDRPIADLWSAVRQNETASAD